MSDFNPPVIKKHGNYKVEDVVVLYELNKRATYVDNPLKTFTGHHHRFEDGHRFIKFTNVVSRLQENGLIRENYPKEVLEKLTIPELKVILKSIGEKTSGVKKLLIERVEQFANDEDISSNTDKRYFVLTELGCEVLNKYNNVIWIYLNREYIFTYPIGYRSKFDEYYFMKNWDKDPKQTLIDYYKTRDSGVVARVYNIINEPDKTFYYGIKKFTEELVVQMDRCKNRGFCHIEYGLGEFMIMPIRHIYNNLNITEDSLDEALRYIYNYSVTDASLINYSSYKELIISLLTNVDDSVGREIMQELGKKIRADYGFEQDYDISNESEVIDNSEYEEDSLMDMLNSFYDDREEIEEVVLNLIDELPFDFLDKLNSKVVNRIKSGK